MAKLRHISAINAVLPVAAYALILAGVPAAPAQAPDLSRTQMATQDRVQLSGWWPTKGEAAREQYVGPSACAECHVGEAKSQSATPMAHASTPAADSKILQSHQQLKFSLGPYLYEIRRTNPGSTYSVSQGGHSVSAPIAYAFGLGEVGQTYVYQQNGNFYESRLSFYDALDGLDFTPGHPRVMPSNLDSALGRQIDSSEQRLCFGCHTTASTAGNRFDASKLIPGVTCESCHGPGLKHVTSMKEGNVADGLKAILDPAHLAPIESVEFCGACHRTLWDVNLAGTMGVFNVRFQPYRLERSKCFGKGTDSRITCLACHDPHEPRVRDAGFYDQRCLRCHSAQGAKQVGDHPGRACPVATKDCVTCHMPKTEIPGMHSKFTDHFIRVVRKGAPYPN